MTVGILFLSGSALRGKLWVCVNLLNSVDYRNWFPTVTNRVILCFWHGWGDGFPTSKSF